jgi:hypothetical protein
MDRMSAFTALLLLGACAACSPEGEPREPLPPVDLVVSAGNMQSEGAATVWLKDQDDVRLVNAPQGGHVLHIAARIEAVRTKRVEIRAQLRHPDTGAIEAEEARTINVVETAPGAFESKPGSISDVAHIPVCPNYGTRDVLDQEWLLDVTVTELPDRTGVGSTEVRVTPRCNHSDAKIQALCQCECAADYVLGKCGGGG